MKKRIMPILIAAASLCTTMNVFADYSFSDIAGENYSWCAPQIETMYKAGYINGYEDGTYRPDNQVTKLECIALFARAMGSADKANDEILELAHSQYDSALAGSSLAWGQDELAYMMYKGAIKQADLTTYINGDEKNKPMTRGEAAVIITKAMGGETKATSNSAVSLHYKDARDIPTNILQYVKFVTDEGIMNGIDDAFCADGTVTRSQIAVMLNRVTDKCDYTFKKGRINSVDTENGVIKYTENGSTEKELEYSSETLFYIKGEKTTVDNIPDNVAVLIQYSGSDVVSFDAMSDVGDEKITAVYAGYNTSGNTMLIKVKSSEASQNIKTYSASIDVPVTYQGTPATIKSLQNGDSVILSLSDGKVQSIEAVGKEAEIKNATVASVDISGDTVYVTISSSDEEFDGNKYPVSDTVSVKKNNKDADLTSLYPGDKITLTLKYGEIVKISATAVNSTIEGVITNISIGTKNEITLNVGGNTKTYLVPMDCSIEKNGETTDIYALRLGDNLKLTVQSDTVISIKSVASVTIQSGKVSGTVTAVNSSYKFVSVLTEGSTEPINVHINSSTKYTLIKGTSNKTGLAMITAGDVVECYVTPTNGAYVADLIVISKTN